MAETNNRVSIHETLAAAAPGTRIRFAFAEEAVTDGSLMMLNGALLNGLITLTNDDAVALRAMLAMGDWCGDARRTFDATIREPMPAWARYRLASGLAHIELLA